MRRLTIFIAAIVLLGAVAAWADVPAPIGDPIPGNSWTQLWDEPWGLAGGDYEEVINWYVRGTATVLESWTKNYDAAPYNTDNWLSTDGRHVVTWNTADSSSWAWTGTRRSRYSATFTGTPASTVGTYLDYVGFTVDDDTGDLNEVWRGSWYYQGYGGTQGLSLIHI